MPTKTEIVIPRPHAGQQAILDGATRFNAVPCGRRFGKTTLGTILLATPENLRHPQGWFSAIYKDMQEVWREVKTLLAPIITSSNASDWRIELTTGGVIEFWTLNNQDAGRGRKYKRIIIDEAGKAKNLLDVWNLALRPTLVDLSGDAYFFGTPKGLNGFYHLYQNGLDPLQNDWTSFSMPTSANPHIPPQEVEALKTALSERAYQQEILAQFLESGGGVFRNVQGAATATPQNGKIFGHSYTIGVDLARSYDFNVIVVLDATTNEVVAVDRFNQVDVFVQVSRIKQMWERFGKPPLVVEQNSAHAIIDLLQAAGAQVIPFLTTNASKAAAVQSLEQAFDYGTIRIPQDDVMIAELMSFEADVTRGGLVRYSAPDGQHDDTVMALAIAWYNSQQAQDVVTELVSHVNISRW